MRKTTPHKARLEIDKRASTAQLLFKCARLINERAMERVNREAGSPVLKAAYTSLFPHLDFEGVRIVDLAKRLGISKQAVSHTIGELVEHGVVELIPDPADGRAKLARFTPRGAEAISSGLRVLSEIERELAREIGDAAMHSLHDSLIALEAVLDASAIEDEAGTPSPPSAPPRTAKARASTKSRRRARS